MLHILLVEDNPADVLMVREAIRTSSVDADVVIAYDGEQALLFLTEFKFEPDLLILDLNIPKFSGFDILERFRPDERPPVIVLTSSSNPANEQRARELGVIDYVMKPITLEPYLQLVRQALKRWNDLGKKGAT